MSAAGIAPEDVIAAAGFIGVVVAALGYHAWRSAMDSSPRARMRQRVTASVAEVSPVVHGSLSEEAGDVALRRKKLLGTSDHPVVEFLTAAKERLEHFAGASATHWVVAAAAVTGVAAAVLAVLGGFSAWSAAAIGPALGVVGGAVCYNRVVTRYRTRFLAVFPDALDLIIRAVRAGVPVVQAIITAGKELPDPVGREFRLMGDALRLGMDQHEVMEAASRRIGVPDFRFFVVCLQTQRETGGPLSDTLENLSNIIRARREVRLKTRALTAQGRAASKIIAAVPVLVVGALRLVGGDYLGILFNTPAGRNILWTAGIMVALGLLVISRMSRLED